jgi:transcriptional regulator with XRE-family HTH domain
MKERILKFLESEKVSPSEFADKIGVQRSSMSHILNGRNYPSAAFIQKMLHAYPNVNSRWLLIGDGQMRSESAETKDNSIKSIFSNISSPVPDNKTEFQSGSKIENEAVFVEPSTLNNEIDQSGRDRDIRAKELSSEKHAAELKANDFKISGLSEQSKNEEKEIITQFSNAVPQSEKKEIEQILFFFKDKTFRIYQPS